MLWLLTIYRSELHHDRLVLWWNRKKSFGRNQSVRRNSVKMACAQIEVQNTSSGSGASATRPPRFTMEGVGARVIRGPDWKWGKQVSSKITALGRTGKNASVAIRETVLLCVLHSAIVSSFTSLAATCTHCGLLCGRDDRALHHRPTIETVHWSIPFDAHFGICVLMRYEAISPRERTHSPIANRFIFIVIFPFANCSAN